MGHFTLTKGNVQLIAARCYSLSGGGDYANFKRDLGQAGAVKKMIRNVTTRGLPLNRELLINKVIIIANNFGPHFTVAVLYYLITDQEDREIIDDVLRELSYI